MSWILYRYHKIIISIICVLSGTVANADVSNDPDPTASASFYIDTYGEVDESTSVLAKRAKRVFERVKQVAEDPIDLAPSLKIINSTGKPWAIALPDGYIILTSGTLDVCYRGVNNEIGDARLAFVLGHELAHLTSKDSWHHEIYLALSGKQNDEQLKRIQHLINNAVGNVKGGDAKDWRNIIKGKELKADDAGFLFASLAGFRTDRILSANNNSNSADDFLRYWVDQTGTNLDSLHFKPEERSAFLQNRFKKIIAKVEYFMSGIRLAHFGRSKDAVHFFKNFQQAFPAHEVLNNLGYVYLKLARKHMPAGLRNRYWIPTHIENVPAIFVRNRGLDNVLSDKAQFNLDRAIEYLSKATEAHNNHLASRINLAGAYMYVDQYHKARAVIEEALILAPKDKAVAEMKALIMYEQEREVDLWKRVVDSLKQIAVMDEPRTFYNLAGLYEDRGRKSEAAEYWRKVVSLSNQVPGEFLRVACDKIAASNSCANTHRYRPNIPSPVNIKLAMDSDIDLPATAKYFKGWQRQNEKIGPMSTVLYAADNGDSYLAINGRLTLAVVKNHSYKTTTDLIRCCGKPISVEKLGEVETWSYGSNWSVLVDNDKVREFWIIAEGKHSVKVDNR